MITTEMAIGQNNQIKDLLVLLVSKLPSSTRLFEEYYFRTVSMKLVFDKSITQHSLVDQIQGIEIDSVDKIHKLTVLYYLFFKNQTFLYNYIIEKLVLLSKPISRYTLKNLFLYYSCIRKLDTPSSFDEYCLHYIDKFYQLDGSYANHYGSSGNIGSTFDAILLKYWLLPSYCLDENTMKFLRSCYCAGYGFATNPQKKKISISSNFDGYFISSIFDFIKKEHIIDIVSYIVRMQSTFNSKQLFQSILILKTILDSNMFYFHQIY